MNIGIAFDLKSDFSLKPGDPDDRLEEYDSTATLDGLEKALVANGHQVRRLGGGRRFLETVLRDPPDLVFNIAEGHGTRSREAHVPSVCEMLRIPYTHSDPLTLAVTLDKAIAKKIVAADGIPTAPFVLTDDPDDPALRRLRPPLIAKPHAEGSSMGIRKASRTSDPAALRDLVASIVAQYGQPALVEEFLTGPEFTVGVLGTGRAARIVGVMEIVPKKVSREEFVYSIEVKRDWEQEVDYFIPPRQPDALVRRIQEVVLGAYRSLGCRDVARMDVRVDRDGEPNFIEVNPLPGLNHVLGDLPILARRIGMPYESLIGQIVKSACERNGLACA